MVYKIIRNLSLALILCKLDLIKINYGNDTNVTRK